MDSIIGLKELRQNTEKYIGATQRGFSFTVVRRSRPIFKLVPVDEWGDEGKWESVIDFRKLKKNGVLAGAVLKTLRKIRDEA